MGKSNDLIEFVDDRPGHDFRYSLDSTKIMNELKWKSKIEFQEGITKTVKWYEENLEWVNNISKDILKSTPWKKE